MPEIANIKLTSDQTEAVLSAMKSQCLKAMEECGLLAEKYAKALCPVDTGNLRNSISHKVVEENKAISCYIGTNVEYAPYVELGTGQYYNGGTGGRQTGWSYTNKTGIHGTKGQRPQAYLRPAIADHENKYNQIIREELKK